MGVVVRRFNPLTGIAAVMHHPERWLVYYGFSQVQPTKVFVEGTFIYHRLSLCFLLSFMASRAKISSDPAVLLEYMEGLSCDSKSDDDFDVMYCINANPRSSGFPTYRIYRLYSLYRCG